MCGRFRMLLVLLVLASLPGCGGIVKGLAGQAGRQAAKSAPKAAGSAATRIETVAAKAAVHAATKAAVCNGAVERLAVLQATSRRVGERLAELKPRIPSDVYGQLLEQWSAIDAGLWSCERDLRTPSPSPESRSRIEARIEELGRRTAQIETSVGELR